jgi:aryl-alcohol dehydrogenase-like predicted oxidoreductase
MRTVSLGDTGERVSALCLGAMNFGTKLDEPGSTAVLDRYWEAGGRFIDTANNYALWWGGDGTESESLLGRWMRSRKNRDELFLATKVGFNRPPTGNGLSRAIIRREIEGSLRRLGTDRVDLYYAHRDHRGDPLEETLAAFDELHREGKVKLIGCSNHRAWRIERARTLSRTNGWPVYCGVQQRYTYLRPVGGARFDPQLAVDDELRDYCAAHSQEFLLLGYSSTLGGAYNRRPDRPIPPQYGGAANEVRLAMLAEVAREVGSTPLQLVYAWMLHSTPLALPLVSAGSVQQLEENLGALKTTLDAGQMKRLDEAGDPTP